MRQAWLMPTLALCIIGVSGCGRERLNPPGPAEITVTPDTLDFGDVPVASIVTRNVTARNTGDRMLNVSAISVEQTGLAFAVSPDSMTIPKGGADAIVVTFAPSVLTTFTGNLLITSDAENDPAITVSLAGRGVETTICGPCDSPPAAYCLTENDAIAYERNGHCENGECKYDSHVTACEHGCDAAVGACADCTPVCTDPCGGPDSCGGICPDNCTVEALCSVDDVSGFAQSGTLAIGPAADLIPLCSGVILVGDRSTNKVLKMNARTGAASTTYQLDSAPGDMEVDSENGLLYVALHPASHLAKVNLATNTLTTITLATGAIDLAWGNGGRIFASLDDNATWPNRNIAVVDGLGAVVEKSILGEFDVLLVYDRPGDQLIVGGSGSSPSSLTRYAFDGTALTLTQTEQRWDAGSNGQDLAISPNGDHIAFPCGGGNGAGYTIYDFDSVNLQSIYGEWNTDAYPSSAAFSVDGAYLVATNGYDSIMIFDTSTHAMLHEWPISFSDCEYGDIHKVGISRGGRIVYGLSYCGFDGDSGKLFWFRFDP